MNKVITPEELIKLLKNQRFKYVELIEHGIGWSTFSGTNATVSHKFNKIVVIHGTEYYVKIRSGCIYKGIYKGSNTQDNYGDGYMIFKYKYDNNMFGEVCCKNEDVCWFSNLDDVFEKLGALEYLDKDPLIKKSLN